MPVQEPIFPEGERQLGMAWYKFLNIKYFNNRAYLFIGDADDEDINYQTSTTSFNEILNGNGENTSAPQKIMFCRKCGTKLVDESEFCHKCGTRISRNRN